VPELMPSKVHRIKISVGEDFPCGKHIQKDFASDFFRWQIDQRYGFGGRKYESA